MAEDNTKEIIEGEGEIEPKRVKGRSPKKTTTVEEPLDIEPPPEPEKEPVRTCKYCGKEFTDKAEHARHMRFDHKKDREKDQTLGGIPETDLSQKAQDFAGALDAAVESLSQKARNRMIQAFENYASVLLKDQTAFENFLDDYGLTYHQQRRIIREVFPQAPPRSPQGGQMMFNPQTGQYQYVPMILGGQGRDQPNINVTLPGGPGQQFMPPMQPQKDNDLWRKVDMIEYQFSGLKENMTEIKTDIGKLVETIQAGRDQSKPQAQYRRIPLLDDNGQVMKDSSGVTLYQEVPWDRDMSSMELLKFVASCMKREEPKGTDPELMRLQIKEQISEATRPIAEAITKISERPAGTTETEKELAALKAKEAIREELAGTSKEQEARIKELSDKVNKLQSETEIKTAVDAAIQLNVAPLKEEINSLRGRTGLSESQFALTHKETLANLFYGFASNMMDRVSGDLKPLALTSLANQMKGMGMSDAEIGTIIQNASRQVSPGASTAKEIGSGVLAKAQEFRNKYLKG